MRSGATATKKRWRSNSSAMKQRTNVRIGEYGVATAPKASAVNWRTYVGRKLWVSRWRVLFNSRDLGSIAYHSSQINLIAAAAITTLGMFRRAAPRMMVVPRNFSVAAGQRQNL